MKSKYGFVCFFFVFNFKSVGMTINVENTYTLRQSYQHSDNISKPLSPKKESRQVFFAVFFFFRFMQRDFSQTVRYIFRLIGGDALSSFVSETNSTVNNFMAVKCDSLFARAHNIDSTSHEFEIFSLPSHAFVIEFAYFKLCVVRDFTIDIPRIINLMILGISCLKKKTM